jgi:hypothetical protein
MHQIEESKLFEINLRGHTMYTDLGPPKDNKPTSSLVVYLVDGERIARVCIKLACTLCQLMPS